MPRPSSATKRAAAEYRLKHHMTVKRCCRLPRPTAIQHDLANARASEALFFRSRHRGIAVRTFIGCPVGLAGWLGRLARRPVDTGRFVQADAV